MGVQCRCILGQTGRQPCALPRGWAGLGWPGSASLGWCWTCWTPRCGVHPAITKQGCVQQEHVRPVLVCIACARCAGVHCSCANTHQQWASAPSPSRVCSVVAMNNCRKHPNQPVGGAALPSAAPHNEPSTCCWSGSCCSSMLFTAPWRPGSASHFRLPMLRTLTGRVHNVGQVGMHRCRSSSC